jgi:D-3-phosphoglycerate dehydrogenase / 2-oxoglutarate reductase
MVHILIADTMHPSILPLLAEKNLRADYRPDIQRADIIAGIGEYEGIIIRSKTVLDEEVLARATRLQFIARAGAGLDLIDLEAVQRRNIQLFNAPEGNRDAVAEHALGMLLCLLNRIHLADREVREQTWDREGNRGTELGGKTVGLIGYGNTGRAFARRLQSFGCQVLAYDRYQQNFSDAYAREATMDELYAHTDVLSLHIPLTAETHRMVNREYLSRFRKNLYVINTARGEVIPLAELKSAIESGKVRGACLDVLENEKLKTLRPEQLEAFNWLKNSPEVLLTPHVAGWTHESYVRINEVLVGKISAWLAARE